MLLQIKKKEPIHKWEKDNKTIAITGLRKSEGGQRGHLSKCIITAKGKVVKFHPLLVVDEKEFDDWFIEKYNIKLCKLYYSPFNFERTGCKGCPFALKLQEQLDIMAKLLPNEYKQCELIWKPVYNEYRRIGYRLDKRFGYKLGSNKQAKLF